MDLKVLKLGTECLDKATCLKGTLTHWVVNMGGDVYYLFQPKGLDEEGQPIKRLILELARLKFDVEMFETVDVPLEILGTIVTDKPSGFTGMAVEFVRHVNGCFHVVIQPQGILAKTKNPIQKGDFDLRSCTGKKIIELSNAERKKSKEECPSPTSDTTQREQPRCVSDTVPQR